MRAERLKMCAEVDRETSFVGSVPLAGLNIENPQNTRLRLVIVRPVATVSPGLQYRRNRILDDRGHDFGDAGLGHVVKGISRGPRLTRIRSERPVCPLLSLEGMNEAGSVKYYRCG